MIRRIVFHVAELGVVFALVAGLRWPASWLYETRPVWLWAAVPLAFAGGAVAQATRHLDAWGWVVWQHHVLVSKFLDWGLDDEPTGEEDEG